MGAGYARARAGGPTVRTWLGTLHATGWVGLWYVCQEPGLWRFVNWEPADGDVSGTQCVGQHYGSRALLLADMRHYAEGAGFEPA